MLLLFSEFVMVVYMLGVWIWTRQWHPLFLPLIFASLAFLLFYRRKIVEDVRLFRTKPRDWWYGFWKEWGEPVLVAVVLALLIRTFILGPYKIPTGSMIPTFQIGDRIFVDKVTYRFRGPERGDIIVFKFPLDKKKDFVKRLVGLPGDSVKIADGKLIVNGESLDSAAFSGHYYYNLAGSELGKEGQTFSVPPGSYFVLGDNSAHSHDSRAWGFVPKENLVGKAFLIWWPPQRIKFVK